MRTLIIIAHPNVEESSTQQFLIDSSKSIKEVNTYILEEKIDKEKSLELLKNHERIIFQFPMYWYSAPFLLKKWIDLVFDDSLLTGSLLGKEMGIVVSLGVSEENFVSGGKEKFTLSELFRPFEALANKCQMTYLPIFSIPLFSYMKERKKKELLIAYQQYLTKSSDISFKSKEEWFIKKLKGFSQEETRENKEQLSIIGEALVDNQETLEDLLVLVKEMREYGD